MAESVSGSLVVDRRSDYDSVTALAAGSAGFSQRGEFELRSMNGEQQTQPEHAKHRSKLRLIAVLTALFVCVPF